jgi:hypothetical protein
MKLVQHIGGLYYFDTSSVETNKQDNISERRMEGSLLVKRLPRDVCFEDRVKSECITVQPCPTEEILADFFTKPLQGSLFRNFIEVLVGYKHIGTLKHLWKSPSYP